MSRKKKKIETPAVEEKVTAPVNDGYSVVEVDLDAVGVEFDDGSISEYEKTIREIENYKEPGVFKRFLKAILPWSGDSFKEVVRKIVFIAALAVFVFSAIYIVNYQIDKKENESMMSEFIDGVSQVDKDINDKMNYIIDTEFEQRVQDKLKEMIAQGMDPTMQEVEDAVRDEIRDEVEALTLEEIKAKYPNIKFPEGITAKYAELYAKNQEMVGWIKINNTEVDFPVVQTTDNDKYLEYNFYKYKSTYGCPFVDYRNNVLDGIENFDTNTTIYGHHIRNGAMFAKLDVYKKLSGYKASPVIEFDTLTGSYKWKVVSVFITNVYAKDDNGYVFNYTSTLGTQAEYDDFVYQIKARSMYDIDVDIQPGDKFLTLSTCSYDFDGARLVIVGRLVREGEDAGVDVSKVTVNNDARYPQAWYDANGKTNPHIGATKPTTTTTTTTTKKPTTTTATTTTQSGDEDESTTTTTTKKKTTTTTKKKTTTTRTQSTTTSTTVTTTQTTTENTTTTTEATTEATTTTTTAAETTTTTTQPPEPDNEQSGDEILE